VWIVYVPCTPIDTSWSFPTPRPFFSHPERGCVRLRENIPKNLKFHSFEEAIGGKTRIRTGSKYCVPRHKSRPRPLQAHGLSLPRARTLWREQVQAGAPSLVSKCRYHVQLYSGTCSIPRCVSILVFYQGLSIQNYFSADEQHDYS
jgi:hypothetical protein